MKPAMQMRDMKDETGSWEIRECIIFDKYNVISFKPTTCTPFKEVMLKPAKFDVMIVGLDDVEVQWTHIAEIGGELRRSAADGVARCRQTRSLWLGHFGVHWEGMMRLYSDGIKLRWN